MINFDEMISNYLKRAPSQKQEGRYYPSQIGTCIRKVWYSYKFPVETSAELAKVFEVGNMMHDFIVKVIQSEKNPHIELLKSEFPFREEMEDFVISGRIDDLVLIKENSKKVLVEVKSTASIDMIKEPIESNVMQLQLYMHFFGIDDGLLLYIDKRDMRCKNFEIKYNVDNALSILKRFSKLHKHLAENKLPEAEARTTEKTLWLCKRCEYKEKCYADTPEKEE